MDNPESNTCWACWVGRAKTRYNRVCDGFKRKFPEEGIPICDKCKAKLEAKGWTMEAVKADVISGTAVGS